MESQALLLELGRRLREARVRAGLSVTELARAANVSRRHVTEAEAGRANLSVAKLFALSTALGVRLAELVDVDPGVVRGGRIALVGLRGAGKSTVGPKLALALEVPFVELDRRVEELAGLSLAAIFELHGTAGYRRAEAEALEQVLSEGDRLVIATGGSIVAAPATFARLLATCHTVWLEAEPEQHYARVVEQGDRRPMRGRPRAMEELREILAQREGQYARCELTVDTSASSVEHVVHKIVERFGSA